ncbi:MAG TPA: DUF2167 domain-containing protein [Opitutaceae bacterium]
MKPLRFLIIFFACWSFCAAAAPTPNPQDEQARLHKLAEDLNYQSGKVTLPGGVATINLPQNFRYLNPHDTAVVLSDLWHNPRDTSSLGMIVPADFSPFQGDAWAVVLSYSEDGYVKDDDAATINYDKLLKQMKESVADASSQRVKQGYESIELIGWAKPPRYDQANHKLYWAKELRFGGQKPDTLNYNIRMLGRRGVLVLNAVAGMDQLADVEKATPDLLAMVNFQEGHRYADFNPSTDKIATYGLAALVVGGIAAKAGLFKMILLGILAAKKFIIFGLVAIGGFFKKLFGARKSAFAAEEPATAPASASNENKDEPKV